MNNTLMICLTIIFTITLIGLFTTKTKGFGKYTTSLLLLILILFVSSFFFALDKITLSFFGNIMFSITGFGGGLISAKKLDENKS
ncbi:MAG: hypothetical protein IMY67_09135 [Bacteroidetes bacterium]|nr:hypothetical protein [Bacteroidota bacterium]